MRASRPRSSRPRARGILRRGLAVARADVAVITSIAADHFGEFGVHDLETLIDVKLAVARALGAAESARRQRRRCAPRRQGCGRRQAARLVRAGRRSPAARRAPQERRRDGRRARAASCCRGSGAEHDLGAIGAMPLAAGGHSHFNVANLADARRSAPPALASSLATIAAAFARFRRGSGGQRRPAHAL